MKKFRVSPSILLLILVCILCGQFTMLINYFFALTLHELAHLFIATRRGYTLKQIKLDMFGMSVELGETIDDKDSFAINIAGPLLNILLCLICMAFYWLIPTSFQVLNTFCLANLILAVFNLLPVYPLDGGKIFRGIIKSNKTYRILNRVIRYLLASVFICLFVISTLTKTNWLFILMAVFFITSKPKQAPTMSIFKYRQNKHFDKVVILKVSETENLFNLIKQIKSHHYTIFYVPKLEKYFNEDNIIELSLKFPLNSTLKEVK